MWIMTSYGILMPAELPVELVDTRFGWDMQVRARDRRTLRVAIAKMKDLKMNVSAVQATPQLDYEYRFYCNRLDFARLMHDEITEIDYQKFKPTTELREEGGGPRLHTLYNKIWCVVINHYDPQPKPKPKKRKRWYEDV
jgi:hypothetical protein